MLFVFFVNIFKHIYNFTTGITIYGKYVCKKCLYNYAYNRQRRRLISNLRKQNSNGTQQHDVKNIVVGQYFVQLKAIGTIL